MGIPPTTTLSKALVFPEPPLGEREAGLGDACEWQLCP